MSKPPVTSLEIQGFALWDKMKTKRVPLSFDLEVTARCNNDCRHCYINLPAGDRVAGEKELSLEEIKEVIDEAVSLGALWCLLTGGEPLLREDFSDIYLYLKRKGLLISVFTNATLVTEEHAQLFRRYPPRDIEVTVYGVTRETYERVTRRSGAFDRFMCGLNLLFDRGVRVRLKAMAMQLNVHELEAIAQFCREHTKDYYRFDPQLHLRFDGNPSRNEEIKAERLTPEQIVALERADEKRFTVLCDGKDKLINPEFNHFGCDHLFHCGAGSSRFSLSYDGLFRLCSSLWHPDCVYDLRKGTLSDAWHNLVPCVRDRRSNRKEFLDKCRVCPLINLCMWCPAHAHLETGEIDAPVNYFCEVAHARAAALKLMKI